MNTEAAMAELNTALEYLASDIYYGEIGTDGGGNQTPPEELVKILKKRFRKVFDQVS